MILEGNQRGGARQLAQHLMNTHDNEHAELYEISGFMSDNVKDALDEIHAVNRDQVQAIHVFGISQSTPGCYRAA